MFGEGYGIGEEAQLWATQRGIADGIEFRGKTPNQVLLAELHEEVDVLVHPSLNEAFSVTILDAMCLGKAIIAGAETPGVPEMLGGGSGLVVHVRDRHQIAAAMKQIVDSPDLVPNLGAQARQRAAALYSSRRIIGLYEDVYREFSAQVG
jgi:glycosyltransferase involved in cell wall biosynthesis